MKPNYVAKKSKVAVLSIWLILFCWLIIPAIVQIVRLVKAHCYSIEFYDERIVIKSGVLNKNERQSVFAGVYSVSVHTPFLGSIFGYGDVAVDCPGRWDVDTIGIKAPQELKRYLESKITSKGMTNIIHN